MDSPFNIEHIIGEQFAKALDMPFPGAIYWGDWMTEEAKRFQLALENRVCAHCNGHWMKKTDDRVMGFLRNALCDAEGVDLTKFNQDVLSRWSVKVALLVELYLHDRALTVPNAPHRTYLPSEHFRYLRKHQVPTPETRVWIGHVDRGELPPFWSLGGRLMIHQPENWPEGNANGYLSQFSLGHLFVRVVGYATDTPEDIKDLMLEPNEVVPDGMLSIWPSQKSGQRWPPLHKLTPEDVRNIAQLHAYPGTQPPGFHRVAPGQWPHF